MKQLLSIFICVVFLSLSAQAQINWRGTVSSSGLSTDEVGKGLKEALSQGTKWATDKASLKDGFFKNPQIFIPFPADAKKVEQRLRSMGLGKQVDQFILTLNRAAEESAKKAAPIFLNAITKLTIADAMAILQGGNGAATSYLRSNTEAQLAREFMPIIQAALNQTAATKYWRDLVSTYNKLPMVQKVNPNLDQYACSKALNGLFTLVTEEENKIRTNPAARVSDLLRRVFK